MELNYKIVCTAIVALALIECFAIVNGINGTVMMIVVAAIAGLGGWVIPTPNLKGGK